VHNWLKEKVPHSIATEELMDREEEALQSIYSGVVNRGDLFWIAPDESRGSVPGFAHPHVVVQDDVFNHSRISTVIVCALSSNLNRAGEPGNVLLEPGEGDLERQSVVIVSQVSSVYKSRLGEYIGTLSSERVDQIVAGMRFQQAAFFNGR
jgi:mRNA interferase MazF